MTDDNVVQLHEHRRKVNWDDLPPELQANLEEQFEAEMRANFATIEPELMVHFLENEVPDLWQEFLEWRFAQEMQSVDTQCAWSDFLDSKGIE